MVVSVARTSLGGMRHVSEPDRTAPTATTRGLLDPAAARGAFELVRLAPVPELADVVERHWVVRWDVPPGTTFEQVVVPHPNANLVAEADVFAAHGIPPGLFHRTLHGTGAVVGTKLRPGALRLLLDHPAAVRPGVVVPATSLLGAGAGAAGLAAVEAAREGRDQEAVAVLTPLLRAAAGRARTRRSDAALARVAQVLGALVGGGLGPGATVGDLAALAGTSTRSLQRLFAYWVGVSPKWVLQRHRVHLAAELLAADPGLDLAELATAVGYYDQAHLGTDFLRATGTTPAAYARRCARSRQTVLARA